ncbi:unnamed protein product [Boreogadus saida]
MMSITFPDSLFVVSQVVRGTPTPTPEDRYQSVNRFPSCQVQVQSGPHVSFGSQEAAYSYLAEPFPRQGSGVPHEGRAVPCVYTQSFAQVREERLVLGVCTALDRFVIGSALVLHCRALLTVGSSTARLHMARSTAPLGKLCEM